MSGSSTAAPCWRPGFAVGALVPAYGSNQSLGWGTPASTALKVAVTGDGNSSQATIFRYSASSLMVGSVKAAARRVFFGLAATDALTAGGLSLLDNAIAQAAGLTAVPPPLDLPPPPPHRRHLRRTPRFGPNLAAGRRRHRWRMWGWTRRVPPTP